jgi:hypothetical protein
MWQWSLVIEHRAELEHVKKAAANRSDVFGTGYHNAAIRTGAA